jgi:simple sugar transport system permease protein
LLAGVLKAKFGVNEMIVTMMMNFVATATMIELAGGPWRDPFVLIAETRMIAPELRFPFIVYPLNTVFLIALVLIPVVYVLVEKTVLGYKMRVVGGSIAAATYAGISPGRVIMLCMFLSGGICALAGATLVFGHFFSAGTGISGMYGFYAIVCTLLGGTKPKMMFFTSLLIAFILTGTNALRALGIPGGFADVMIGLMFVMAALPELLARRRSK